MSKKGAVAQLQTDITSDEELEKFMEKDGLMLLEVYTGWCGPCTSMLASLKKIKLEKGGEDLVLATIRADDVKTFERLRNKSEPTWLLATRGVLVNGMFGSNVPKLMKMISDEIDAYHKLKSGEVEAPAVSIALNEMVPCELERYNARKQIEDNNARIEAETAAQNRIDYLTHVTDEIADHLNEMGVTIMMPHTISKDILKQLPELADKFGLSAKDKRLVLMRPEDLEVLHFECANPLPAFALQLLFAKEAYMVAWKNADSELEPVEVILRQLVDSLTLPQPIRGDLSETPVKMPPVLRSLRTEIGQEEYDEFKLLESEVDLFTRERIRSLQEHRRAAGIESEVDVLGAEEAKTEAAEVAAAPAEAEEEEEGAEGEGEEEEGGQGEEEMVAEQEPEEGEDADEANERSVATPPEQELAEVRLGSEVEEEPEAEAEEVGAKYTVEILPMWTPENKRATAAAIYLYFRHLTDHFLPPDPEPDPPHVVMIFDAIKRNDIMNQLEIAPQDFLAYGYFSAEDPVSAKLLATSTYKYEKIKKKAIADRLIIKVSKKTSNTLLALTTQGPNYVSLNTVEGEIECKQFFPAGYKNTSETGEEEEEEEEEEETEEVADGALGDDEEADEEEAEANADGQEEQ